MTGKTIHLLISCIPFISVSRPSLLPYFFPILFLPFLSPFLPYSLRLNIFITPVLLLFYSFIPFPPSSLISFPSLSLLSHTYSMYMRKHSDGEKIDLMFLTALRIFSHPHYKQLVFGIRSICMYVCMFTSLEPERLDGFYSYSAFKSSSILGKCLMNLNLAPKTGAVQIDLKTRNDDFLQIGCNDFGKILLIYEDHISK
jgi:hypothetical protein